VTLLFEQVEEERKREPKNLINSKVKINKLQNELRVSLAFWQHAQPRCHM
jgi:hypothetical protein